jgi:hypothetical protein
MFRKGWANIAVEFRGENEEIFDNFRELNWIEATKLFPPNINLKI